MTDPAKSKAVRYDKNASRIERGGDIVAMALRLANNRWGLYDRDERRLVTKTFENPAAVAEAFDLLQTSPEES